MHGRGARFTTIIAPIGLPPLYLLGRSDPKISGRMTLECHGENGVVRSLTIDLRASSTFKALASNYLVSRSIGKNSPCGLKNWSCDPIHTYLLEVRPVTIMGLTCEYTCIGLSSGLATFSLLYGVGGEPYAFQSKSWQRHSRGGLRTGKSLAT